MICEKYVIRIRHYTERMGEHHFKDDFPEDMQDIVRDFTYWVTSHEDLYIKTYNDGNIETTDNIWDANDYSDLNNEEIKDIIKNVKNQFLPKKDYMIQLKKIKAKI